VHTSQFTDGLTGREVRCLLRVLRRLESPFDSIGVWSPSAVILCLAGLVCGAKSKLGQYPDKLRIDIRKHGVYSSLQFGAQKCGVSETSHRGGFWMPTSLGNAIESF